MVKPEQIQGKIKIVRIIARVIIGGPTVHVVALGTGMDPELFESLLVCGKENPGEESMLDYAGQHGIHPTIVPEIVGEATFGLRDVVAIAKLFRLMRREKPHIVDTHTAKAGFVGRIAAWLARVPIVLHTYHGHVLRGYYSARKTTWLRWMEILLARLSTRIIAVSETTRQELVDYRVAPPEKIAVIHYGFDLDIFLKNRVLPRGKFRQELNIPSDAPLAGIVGRVVPIKNHGLFLDAAQKVLRVIPSAYFVVVGDGPLRADLEAYSRDLKIADRVVFAGWRKDVAQVYRDLDVLVISSINEGAPFTIVEAMASGCPVVATRVGGVPDIVLEGKTAFLTPSDDAASMAEALVKVFQNPALARQMGEAGRTFASENFTTQRLVADTQRLYVELLGNKGLI